MDATARAVMAALTRRGHYPETPDGMAKAVVDATDIVGVFRATPEDAEWYVGEAVYNAVHTGSDLPCDEFDCFEADQDAVWEALRSGGRGGPGTSLRRYVNRLPTHDLALRPPD